MEKVRNYYDVLKVADASDLLTFKSGSKAQGVNSGEATTYLEWKREGM